MESIEPKVVDDISIKLGAMVFFCNGCSIDSLLCLTLMFLELQWGGGGLNLGTKSWIYFLESVDTI